MNSEGRIASDALRIKRILNFITMRSIERVFRQIKAKNPHWSDFINYTQAIKNRKFSKNSISRNFHRLVDSDDYDRADKKTILKQLYQLSHQSEIIG